MPAELTTATIPLPKFDLDLLEPESIKEPSTGCDEIKGSLLIEECVTALQKLAHHYGIAGQVAFPMLHFISKDHRDIYHPLAAVNYLYLENKYKPFVDFLDSLAKQYPSLFQMIEPNNNYDGHSILQPKHFLVLNKEGLKIVIAAIKDFFSKHTNNVKCKTFVEIGFSPIYPASCALLAETPDPSTSDLEPSDRIILQVLNRNSIPGKPKWTIKKMSAPTDLSYESKIEVTNAASYYYLEKDASEFSAFLRMRNEASAVLGVDLIDKEDSVVVKVDDVQKILDVLRVELLHQTTSTETTASDLLSSPIFRYY